MLARRLQRPDRIGYGPRVHQVHPPHPEIVGALEEERPRLGKEECELVVDVELDRVRLDLREIRVRRHVGGHVRRDSPARGQPCVAGRPAFQPVRSGRPLVRPRRCHRRQQLDIASRHHPVESLDLLFLAQVAVGAAQPRKQADVVALRPGIAAHPVDAPGLFSATGVLKTKLVEGNRDFDFVAGVRDAARRIHLHAERVDEELVGSPFVVEGVEHHPDEVVVPGIVPVGEPRPYTQRIRIVALEADEEPRVVVRQEHLGTDRRPDVLSRPDLVEQFQRERVGPGLLHDAAVNDNFGGRGRHRVRTVGSRLRADRPRHCGEQERDHADPAIARQRQIEMVRRSKHATLPGRRLPG